MLWVYRMRMKVGVWMRMRMQMWVLMCVIDAAWRASHEPASSATELLRRLWM